jgi:putative flippase GtrA
MTVITSLHKKPFISKRVLRFIVAGFVNGAVNYAVLNVLFYGLHTSKILAGIIAAFCAMLSSFLLNFRFVFRDKTTSKRKIVRFIAVAVTGSLIVQNIVYALGIFYLMPSAAIISDFLLQFSNTQISSSFILINLSSLIASTAAMIWNYNGYRTFVFKPANSPGRQPEIGASASSSAAFSDNY